MSALARAARAERCDQGWVLGEGLSGPREGFRGFRLDSNSSEREGEGSKGPRGVIRVGCLGRASRGRERALGGLG